MHEVLNCIRRLKCLNNICANIHSQVFCCSDVVQNDETNDAPYGSFILAYAKKM